MKKYVLFYLVLLAGCVHTSDNTKSPAKMPYYVTPEISGIIYGCNGPLVNAPVFLLSRTGERMALTGSSGYFAIRPAQYELIEAQPSNDIGYLYQLVISDGNNQYLWRKGGVGYGFKAVDVTIDVANKRIIYRVEGHLIDSEDVLEVLSEGE